MNAPPFFADLNATNSGGDIASSMQTMGLRAKAASAQVARAPAAIKNRLLISLARLLRQSLVSLAVANRIDLDRASADGLTGPMLDRLKLSAKDIETVAPGRSRPAPPLP